MSDAGIKVTDKRMFTADGELREEYRDLAEAAAAPAGLDEAPAGEPEPAPVRESPIAATPDQPPAGEPESPPRLALPHLGPGAAGTPQFFDLVAALAEPASLYLGDVTLPDGQVAEDLEMARFHIDLLGVLAEKTVARLNAEEARFLDEVLYRLRLRYVQKRG